MKRLALVVAVLAMAGCAGPAAVERMVVPSQEAVSSPLQSQVSLAPVDVTFNPMSTGNVVRIGAPEFESALEQSLSAAGLLSPGEGRYQLTAIPRDLQHQEGVLELTVVAVIDYRLVDRDANQEVFDETISTTGVSGLGEAYAAADRMLYGGERAIAANFAALINELASLNP